jgi:hypothetical protein
VHGLGRRGFTASMKNEELRRLRAEAEDLLGVHKKK